jgi:hypothetical protein
MARKFDEAANFVIVQLTEQKPGIHDKRHPDYARRDKIHSFHCAGLSVCGAAWRHFSQQVAQLFRRKFRRKHECPISLHSEHQIDLAWERISHEMKESGMCVCVYTYIYIYML